MVCIYNEIKDFIVVNVPMLIYVPEFFRILYSRCVYSEFSPPNVMETTHDVLQISGGKPLNGHVKTSGAKNAITKLLVASLLSNKRNIFSNVPNIQDVDITVSLCKEIGMEVSWDKAMGVMEVQTKELKTTYIPQRFSGANRIPILMIGALLGRTDQDIIVPTVGGCNIGKRPVNFHIQALEALGATIEHRQMKDESAYFAHAHRGLHGTVVTLPYPSVGATENTILASIRARGTTIIKNAAIEPEIVDLVLYLQKLGAIITIEVDRTIKIKGTSTFYDVEHTVIPDRLEAASLAMAAIATQGKIFIENARHADLITFLNTLRAIGGGFEIKKDGILFFFEKPLNGSIHIETDVHPGFITDWQQPFVVLLTQTSGTSVVHETVYENRFGYVNTLKEMGADVELFSQCLGGKPCRYSQHDFLHSLIIKGRTPLLGKEIHIPDLRAGFAYVQAALIAKGSSIISGIHYLDRGYERLESKLGELGADISRISLKDHQQTNAKPKKAATAT